MALKVPVEIQSIKTGSLNNLELQPPAKWLDYENLQGIKKVHQISLKDKIWKTNQKHNLQRL